MSKKNYIKRGRLTKAEAADALAALDASDIVFRSLRDTKHLKKIDVSYGFMGIQNRGKLTVAKTRVSTMKNDLVQLLSGGARFGYMHLTHDAAFTYGDDNHADVLQSVAINQRWRKTKLFDGLFIGKAVVKVRGDYKNGFMFTENCTYKNIRLFENGLIYDTDNKQPYFLQSTNFTDAVIGSPEHPLDPKKLSNKAMQIIASKPRTPTSQNIVVHSYDGLDIDVDNKSKKALQWVRYSRDQNAIERSKMFNDLVKQK